MSGQAISIAVKVLRCYYSTNSDVFSLCRLPAYLKAILHRGDFTTNICSQLASMIIIACFDEVDLLFDENTIWILDFRLVCNQQTHRKPAHF